jgi:hypothetical protein
MDSTMHPSIKAILQFIAAALSHFRELQRTSFAILEEAAAGAGSFFHLPVVLFGERTALPGEWAIGRVQTVLKYWRDVLWNN